MLAAEDESILGDGRNFVLVVGDFVGQITRFEHDNVDRRLHSLLGGYNA